MSDLGVGETLAITSLVFPALHAVDLLLNDILWIHDAPSDLTDVQDELDDVRLALQMLEKSLKDRRNIDDEFQDLVCNGHIEKSVTACSGACKGFREQLQKWLRHSTDTEVHWWDRAKVGFLGAKKVDALITELNTCKVTIILALSSAYFLAACEQRQVTKELLKEEEKRIRSEGNFTISSTLDELTQLSLEDDDEEEIDLESMRGLKRNIKQGRTSIQEYKELLATVLVKHEGQRTGVKVKKVKIQGKSNAILDVQNVDGKEDEVQVNIDDVLVDRDPAAMTGVQNKISVRAFRNRIPE